MATGVVIHWSGLSGWIRRTGVGDMPTSSSNDALFTPDVVSGTPALDAAVTFTTTDATPWLAESVTVI